MRSFHAIMICFVVFAVISGGCSFKERQYGKFTEEEIAKMPYAQVEGLPEPTGGITLSIMGETITANEIVNNEPVLEVLSPMAELGVYDFFYVKAKPTVSQLVKTKASDVLIYNLAKKNVPSKIDEMLEKAVEKEVSKYIANYNNNYALAEKAFKEMGFADWNAFREYKKKYVMTQMYMSKKIKTDKPIAHSDMIARYNMYISKQDPDFTWETRVKMRVIDIQPDKLAGDEIKTSDGETKEQAAARKGGELVKRIKAGEDFGKLAEANTHGIGKKTGGLWADTTVGSLAEPYDALEKAALKLNVGDVSDVIAADGHVFIMKLEDKRLGGTVPFIEVQGRIEGELRLIEQRLEYGKVFEDIVKQANVKDLEVFTDYCIKEAFAIIRSSK